MLKNGSQQSTKHPTIIPIVLAALVSILNFLTLKMDLNDKIDMIMHKARTPKDAFNKQTVKDSKSGSTTIPIVFNREILFDFSLNYRIFQQL